MTENNTENSTQVASDTLNGANAGGGANTQRRFEDLPPAAQRALSEAEARRVAQTEIAKYEEATAKEFGGRGGKDPARFGDWEIKGRTIDF